MPTPPRTSLDAIVAAGSAILEDRGLAGLTMQAVAQQVGVRAPSLYKHVADREALISLVTDAAALELASQVADASASLGELARGLRSWAKGRPEAYRLVFSGNGSPDIAPAVSAPVLSVGRALAGDADALQAARLVTAWATGFISMELAGAFKLGGDVDDAFEYGIQRLAAALATPATPPQGYAPDLIVSAVVLRDANGRILTVRKAGTDRFMLPGGKHEPGESAADAAIRECGEELGLALGHADLTHLGTYLANAANEPGFVIEGAVFEHPLTGEPSAAAEIAELRWLDPSAPLPHDLAPLLEHHVLPTLVASARGI